jgi:hypothetical protein
MIYCEIVRLSSPVEVWEAWGQKREGLGHERPGDAFKSTELVDKGRDEVVVRPESTLPLLHTSKLIREEALKTFYSENEFHSTEILQLARWLEILMMMSRRRFEGFPLITCVLVSMSSNQRTMWS